MRRYLFGIFVLLFVAGFVWPERLVNPVQGGKASDWNHKTFWYEPWGKSGVHKGIDIFAKKGTALISSVDGLVVYSGKMGIGGNVILVLGPKWRLHYYAHLESSDVGIGRVVTLFEKIGKVGDSGNARGKPPHLHYSILTLIPYPWRWDQSTQGWKKMFFLDPGKMIMAATSL